LDVLNEMAAVGTEVTRFEVVVGLPNLNTADLPNFSA